MHKIAITSVVVIMGCSGGGSGIPDSGVADGDGGVDRTPHLVQQGDAEVRVFATFTGYGGEINGISVKLTRAGAAVSDGTVQAGPLDAESELVYTASTESFEGTWTGQHALVHVYASWSTGLADMVVAVPAQIITLTPDPIAQDADVTVRWQPWAPDSDGFVNIQAGLRDSTLHYQAIETDLASTAQVVVPSTYFPSPGSYLFDASFNGTFEPTGGIGIGSDTPLFSVGYTHQLERTIP